MERCGFVSFECAIGNVLVHKALAVYETLVCNEGDGAWLQISIDYVEKEPCFCAIRPCFMCNSVRFYM